MNKILIYIIGIVLIAGIGFFVVSSGGGEDKESKYSASMLVASESSFDFNIISMDNGDVSHNFEVRNDGEEVVLIERVYTSCMCTTAFILDSAGKEYGGFGMLGHGPSSKTNIEVLPGDSVVVEVIFDPAAHGPSGVGKVKRIIYLETNSQIKPKMQLSIEAEVTNEIELLGLPKVQLSVVEHDFGQISKKDGVVNIEFVLANVGKGELTIGKITTSCGCTSASIDTNSIMPGESAVMTVNFDPNFHGEPQGQFFRSIFVSTNDPENEEIEFKIFVEIKN